jgi:hypothetical protein
MERHQGGGTEARNRAAGRCAEFIVQSSTFRAGDFEH